jgi:glycosyltransferase involved in cell wall biosynthesis
VSVSAPLAEPPLARLTEGGKIVFVVTEDWFFASHFLPMVRAAQEIGLEVAVVTRVRAHDGVIAEAGAKVIPFEAERSSLNPMTAGHAAGRLAAILRAERPSIVHCIAMRSILIGGAAAVLARIPCRVYALTGVGLFGARNDFVGRSARTALRHVIRGLLQSRGTHYLFENPDDAALLGLDPNDTRVTIVGGAGVDPEVFRLTPMPPQPPLKIAVVARMLWSKGVDTAVEAARLARARGAPVELSLFGVPDPSNPRGIPEETLREWDAEPGITWGGPTRDVAAVWRGHHVCCLPSRGGEGLPRTLLEGGACARALVTTDVPGCRALVRDGVEGVLVPPDDVGALADAFVRLAEKPMLVARMGEAARERILDGFTERDVMDSVKGIYTGMLSRR